MRSGMPALVALVISLAGCSSTTCLSPEYGSGDTIPPLEVPLGLDAPDTRNALKIPDLNEPERPHAKGEPCLDEPPPYYSNRRSGDSKPSDSKDQQ